MAIFNPIQFLRHISNPNLRQFTEAHVINISLNIDWSQSTESLPLLLSKAVSVLDESLSTEEFSPENREIIEHSIHVWYDDLRRAHMMSNGLAVKEFLIACNDDPAVHTAFSTRDDREKALWMLAFRDKAFRDAELRIAFLSKTNGKYWKKHRIQPGLAITSDLDKCETFGHEVAKLYRKVGAGKASHIEFSERSVDNSIQLTLYVEGPVTAIAHFAENSFKRITARIALETALVYHPDSGIIETVVKGGGANHAAVLKLFGEHIVGAVLTPEAIEKAKFKLNALRDGMLEPFDDWSVYGVEQVRLRRARFSPTGVTAVFFEIEASPTKEQDDAIKIALNTLKITNSFEMEYNMIGASIIVYPLVSTDQKSTHFSFDVFSSGSSTIKNLSVYNQQIANNVLQALDVIPAAEIPA